MSLEPANRYPLAGSACHLTVGNALKLYASSMHRSITPTCTSHCVWGSIISRRCLDHKVGVLCHMPFAQQCVCSAGPLSRGGTRKTQQGVWRHTLHTPWRLPPPGRSPGVQHPALAAAGWRGPATLLLPGGLPAPPQLPPKCPDTPRTRVPAKVWCSLHFAALQGPGLGRAASSPMLLPLRA